MPQPEVTFSGNRGDVTSRHQYCNNRIVHNPFPEQAPTLTPASTQRKNPGDIENQRQRDPHTQQRQTSLPEQVQAAIPVTTQMPRSIAAKNGHTGGVPAVAKKEGIIKADDTLSACAATDDDVSEFVLATMSLSER